MDYNPSEISSFISEIKSNSNFLKKLLFPRVTIFVALGIVFVVVVVRLFS